MKNRGERIGRLAEKIVARALAELFKEGKIAGFICSPAGKYVDGRGIDMQVQLNNGLFFALQCKCGVNNVGRHFRIHSNIQYVIVIKPYSRAQFKEWVKTFSAVHPDLSLPPLVVFANANLPERYGGDGHDACVSKIKAALECVVAAAIDAGAYKVRKFVHVYVE